jgi:thiol:disulfide interchange protein DsbD
MKKLIYFFIALTISFASMAQNNPVTWKASYKSISATEGQITVTAHIDKGWHTYSQRPVDDGPIPTSFTFTPAQGYELAGKTEESEAHEEFVPAFGAKIFIYTGTAEFTQKIKLKTKTAQVIRFSVEYMSCNDMMCLPPKTVELSVKTQ